MSPSTPPRFACDAMLGGLARWLRAAGYEASWQAGIEDWDLVRLALRDGSVLLTSDTGILRIGIVRDGDVASLFLPNGLKKRDQLALVLRGLNLPLREPRCMACGGELARATREQVGDRVPPRTLEWADCYWQCHRCGQVFWQGTHWHAIARELEAARPPEQPAAGLSS